MKNRAIKKLSVAEQTKLKQIRSAKKSTISALQLETDMLRGRISPNAIYNTIKVGSEFIAGDRSKLTPLVNEKIIVPVAKGVREWGKVKLNEATHFMIPVRSKVKPGLFDLVHGRSIFVPFAGEYYFFKGVGLGGHSAENRSNYKYYKTERLVARQFSGGLLKDHADYEYENAIKLERVYRALILNRHKNVLQCVKLGANFFPGPRDPIIFKLLQVPGEQIVESNLQLKIPHEELINAGIPKAFLDEMVVYCYKTKTPFRFMDLGVLSLEQILQPYGIIIENKKFYLEGTHTKISPANAVNKVLSAFVARQALMSIILKSVNATGRSELENDGLSIFSTHNTTLAGETVDYDVINYGKDDATHKNYWLRDFDLIETNIRLFYKQLNEKMCESLHNNGLDFHNIYLLNRKLFSELARDNK